MARRSLIVFVSLIVYVAANSVSTDESECPQVCPLLYAPICATDGKLYKEFSNACDLKASNCRRERSALQTYAQTDMAWCTSELVDNLLQKLDNLSLEATNCMLPCPMIYKPVCATNGKYRALLSNECMIHTYNCALKATGAKELLRKLQYHSC